MHPRKLKLCFFGVLALMLLVPAIQARAGLNVSINLNAPPPPPAYVLQAPPEVVPVPGTYVYCAPTVGVDILFYQGFWYRPHGGGWFRARSYNGPWGYVVPAQVPQAVVTLPPGYRTMWRGPDRIPYGQLKKNWARWERERHWEGRPEWRDHGRSHDNGHYQRANGWDRGDRQPERGQGQGHGHGNGHGRSWGWDGEGY